MKEIESISQFSEYIKTEKQIEAAFQGIDLRLVKKEVMKTCFKGSIFLGCKMDDEILLHVYQGNYVFPHLDVPFEVYPNKLYNKDSLYKDFDYSNPQSYKSTFDFLVYNHYIKHGKEATSIKETLARRLHDHSITDALYDFLNNYDEKKLVAIMGGHSLPRDNEDYIKAVKISKILTEKGYLMISGGGPGAMEATHVGAWFAGRKDEELDDALKILSEAKVYNDPNWLSTAFRVIEKYPSDENSKYKSLGIPTWLYGHEPPTPFATHIAKYFANSVREEGLLAIAKGGIVFTPGSAGTLQEIFQEAAQNHYESFGYASPMIFLNKTYWSLNKPIYPMIEYMKLKGEYQNLLLSITDEINEVIKALEEFD